MHTVAMILICLAAVIMGAALVMDAIWQAQERERGTERRMEALWRQVWDARW